MVNIRQLFILLFHLACFTLFSSRRRHSSATATRFKNKIISSTKKSISSFFQRLLSSKSNPPPPPSTASSVRSLSLNNPPAIITIGNTTSIFPCSVCGEVLETPMLLQQHQSIKHAISELMDSENIVRIIFQTGWPKTAKTPKIHRILKIHNSHKITSKFEEYREAVKTRAGNSSILSRDERCIADGNELLRFHCTTFICDLNSSICNHQYCSVCGIIRNGFSPKMDGIVTLPTSWRAHAALPEDLEEEFRFMGVRKALLVCRVVAGRVGCDPGLVDKEDPGFDSLVGPGNGGDEEDELLVFNPRAVLPCFVIVYTV